MHLPNETKRLIVQALMDKRELLDGTDGQFARQFGIPVSVFSTMKKAPNLDGLLRDAQWINIARELDVCLNERKWNMARTEIFEVIEEDVLFCKANSKSIILCDDCGIGKTYTAKYLSRTLKNCFYVDASQCGSKNEFTKALAKAIGIDARGRYAEIRRDIKFGLKMLPNPIVIIDEAGELDTNAAMLFKEMWNATEKACGWYLMGAEGLEAKIERRLEAKSVGWAELFSRFNDKYTSIVPKDKAERLQFYNKLLTDVLSVNMEDKTKVPGIVRKCLSNDSKRSGGLRRAETLLLLEAA